MWRKKLTIGLILNLVLYSVAETKQKKKQYYFWMVNEHDNKVYLRKVLGMCMYNSILAGKRKLSVLPETQMECDWTMRPHPSKTGVIEW